MQIEECLTVYLLLNGPASYFYVARLIPVTEEIVAKASAKCAFSHMEYTRNQVIYP